MRVQVAQHCPGPTSSLHGVRALLMCMVLVVRNLEY